MSFLRKLFGKKVSQSGQAAVSAGQRYVICPNCGAGYNTGMVMQSILVKSPFMADMASWTTKVSCRNCGREIAVSGSRSTVFGQPRPR